MKMQFYYIGKDYTDMIPTKSFKAVKMKVNGEDTFVPIMLSRWEKDKEITSQTQFFAYGVGWVKVGKRKLYDVPLFDREAEHWRDYTDQYGKVCLFYSLTGEDLHSNDCCITPMVNEFISINQYGAVRYVDFIKHFLYFNELQKIALRKLFDKYHKHICYCFDKWIEKYLFRPCYNIYWVSFPYSPDTVQDDKRMEALYFETRRAELILSDKRYADYQKLEEEKKYIKEKYSQVSYDWKYKKLENGKSYDEINERCNELYHLITKAAQEQARKEIDEDNDVFPTSVSDRITYIFGKEANKVYTYICDEFLSTDEKKN